MQQETVGERGTGEPDQSLSTLAASARPERHQAVGDADDALVGNGHPVRVSPKIVQHRRQTTQRLLGIDHPVVGVEGLFEALPSEGIKKIGQEVLSAQVVEPGVRLARHYNLYPNPWPKIGHLARRWHGHAVFPVWLQLGGELECRSNWRIYIEEMAQALTLLSGQPVAAEPWHTDDPITPFEKKYLASGHELWRCRVSLP